MFFSGFSLENEEELFLEYSEKSDFVYSGFSYGCIRLINFILENNEKRIDKIQLFSPAFFNDKDEKFKRMQLMFFKKDPKVYSDNFLKNCGFEEQNNKYFNQGSFDELKDLLYYEWKDETLQKLVDRGIKIETYLGADDIIIDPDKALEFFRKFGEVYFIKEKKHIL